MIRSEHNPAVPVSEIFYDAQFNCREEFTLQSVKELAQSIESVGGLICPVTIQPWDREPGYKYRLVVGYRRFRAVTAILQQTTISANIVYGLTDRQAQLLNAEENLQRKDLNMLEEARILQRLYPQGTTERQAAKELKQTCYWVRLRFALLKMPVSIQRKAAAGLLSQANIDTLAGLASEEEQVLLADQIAEARQRGTGKRLPGVEKKYKRISKYSRGREEIKALLIKLLERGIRGLAPRVAAWCAGTLTDEELEADIASAALEPTDSKCLNCEKDLERLKLQTTAHRRFNTLGREIGEPRPKTLLAHQLAKEIKAKYDAKWEARCEARVRAAVANAILKTERKATTAARVKIRKLEARLAKFKARARAVGIRVRK